LRLTFATELEPIAEPQQGAVHPQVEVVALHRDKAMAERHQPMVGVAIRQLRRELPGMFGRIPAG
jgi:hypothetical protein